MPFAPRGPYGLDASTFCKHRQALRTDHGSSRALYALQQSLHRPEAHRELWMCRLWSERPSR